jgi:MFS family permease
MTTFFLLVLPLECRRIEEQLSRFETILQLPFYFIGNKSVALGMFAAIAGLAQLVSPLVGLLSDNYIPPNRYQHLFLLGKRLPYIFLGTFFILLGLSWEFISSTSAGGTSTYELDLSQAPSLTAVIWPWLHYLMAFSLHNLGLNVVYTVMIALIPDLVPISQIGQANGTLALLLVVGSLFGFAMFQTVASNGSFFSLDNTTSSTFNNSYGSNISEMYKVYFGVTIACTVLTYHFVMQRLHHIHNQQSFSYNQHLAEQPLNTITIPETLSPSDSIRSHDHLHHNQSVVINNNIYNRNDMTSSSISQWPPMHLVAYFLLYEPISKKSLKEIRSAYWIESTGIYHDFFIVTLSRLFYYLGISCQTFFLYFVHDVNKRNKGFDNSDSNSTHPIASGLVNPEVTVAVLAIIAQISGAITCYPIGIISDKYFDGRRKPFVYMSCLLLCLGYLTLLLCNNLQEIMGICVLLGAANGMYLTMDTSLAVDTLPSTPSHVNKTYIQPHDNDKMMIHGGGDESAFIEGYGSPDSHGAAQLLGVWGVFGFLGSAMGPLIGGMVLFIFGQPKDTDSFYSFPGYSILFSLSATYFFCAAISLTFIQKKCI